MYLFTFLLVSAPTPTVLVEHALPEDHRVLRAIGLGLEVALLDKVGFKFRERKSGTPTSRVFAKNRISTLLRSQPAAALIVVSWSFREGTLRLIAYGGEGTAWFDRSMYASFKNREAEVAAFVERQAREIVSVLVPAEPEKVETVDVAVPRPPPLPRKPPEEMRVFSLEVLLGLGSVQGRSESTSPGRRLSLDQAVSFGGGARLHLRLYDAFLLEGLWLVQRASEESPQGTSPRNIGMTEQRRRLSVGYRWKFGQVGLTPRLGILSDLLSATKQQAPVVVRPSWERLGLLPSFQVDWGMFRHAGMGVSATIAALPSAKHSESPVTSGRRSTAQGLLTQFSWRYAQPGLLNEDDGWVLGLDLAWEGVRIQFEGDGTRRTPLELRPVQATREVRSAFWGTFVLGYVL